MGQQAEFDVRERAIVRGDGSIFAAPRIEVIADDDLIADSHEPGEH